MEYDANAIALLIDEEARRQGVNPDLVKRVILQGEHYGKPKISDASSPKGATGVGQIMPTTWSSLVNKGLLAKTDDPTNAAHSVKAAVTVLKDNLSRNGGNEQAAIAEYNGGTAARDAVLKGVLPPAKETQDYLARTGATLAPNASTTSGGVLAAVSDELKATMARNAEMIANLRKSTGLQVSAAADMASALLGGGDAAAASVGLKGEQAAAQSEKEAAIVQAFKAGTGDPDGAISKALLRKEQASAAMQQLKPVIDAEDQVSILDDPLRWITNQFTLPKLKMQYNAAHHSKAAAVKEIIETQAMVEAQKRIDPAVVTDQIRQKAAYDAAAVKFDAMAKASEAQFRSASAMAQQAAQEIQLNNFNYNAGTELARMTLSASGVARAEMADKKAEAVLTRVNFKRLQLKLPAYSVEQFEALPAKAKEALIENSLYDTLGKDVGDSLRYIIDEGAAPLLTEAAPAVSDLYARLNKDPQFKPTLLAIQKNPKFEKLSLTEQRILALTELGDSHVKELIDKNNKNSLLREDNPYKLRPATAALVPELAKNPITGVVGEVIAMSPDKKTATDKMIFESVLAKIEADPKKLVELSKALSEFYTVGIDQQWNRTGMRQVGYVRPKGYGVSGESLGYQFDKAIQMAVPSEVENALRQMLAKRKAVEALADSADMSWWVGDPPNWK